MFENNETEDDKQKKSLLDWINSLFELIGFAPKNSAEDE